MKYLDGYQDEQVCRDEPHGWEVKKERPKRHNMGPFSYVAVATLTRIGIVRMSGRRRFGIVCIVMRPCAAQCGMAA
jgi:hypothetical protein